MAVFTDQLNRTTTLQAPPRRIVSLVPSQTELLYHLGLDSEVVGITKFCVHPTHWFQTKARVGGTKNIHVEKVKALQPDLIIANKEENVKEQVEELAAIAPVWTSDINNLDDALSMIHSIGEITGKTSEAKALKQDIETAFDSLIPQPSNPLLTTYLIWKDPYYTVGGDTFIHDMMKRCGLVNLFAAQQRYPEVSVDEFAISELILLSSEPYPFAEKHLAELQSLLPKARLVLVDGEMFSWYGSRLKLAPAYFQQVIQQVEKLIP